MENKMEKKSINYDELPEIIRSVYEGLISREPGEFRKYWTEGCNLKDGPIGLGLKFKDGFYQQEPSKGVKYYHMEADSDVTDGVPDCSVAFRYIEKNDSIVYLSFRFYGETIKNYIEIQTKVYYDSDFLLIDRTEWNWEKQPKRIAVKIEGQEVFWWGQKEKSLSILQDVLGVKECTTWGILNYFTKQVWEECPHVDLDPSTREWVQDPYRFDFFDITVVDRDKVGKLLYDLKERYKGKLSSKAKVGEKYGDYSEYPENLRKYAEKINDEKEDYKIETGLLEQVMRELIRWCSVKEEAEQYDYGSEKYMQALFKENLPNLAFLGEPGTGKTTLAKRLAENVLGAEFYCITGADLKGRYLGQTKSAVVEKFRELRKRTEGDEAKPAVLFIDEAYNLFNNKDEYGSEVIEILLKVMEPGKRDLSATVNTGHEKEETVTVHLDENTAVWLGGYEKDMRKALSVNRGMYRRVKTITLPVPELNSLWENFERIMNQDNPLLKPEIQEANWSLCKKKDEEKGKDNKKVICDYFAWARSKTYAEFFGNYSGVKKLAEEIVKNSLLSGKAMDNWELEDIIERQKAEIRTQYQQVIEENYERLPFLVHTDVEENFADYIGAEGAKEKLRHVMDMICSPEKFPHCESPKGALLMGSPGTGKTYLARCMAGELRKAIKGKNLQKDVAFIKVAATELYTEELVKALFNASEGYDHVIIFIDEIDAIGKRREMLANPSILIQLLNEMDGFEGKCNVFVLAATNAPEVLDAALKRPGRFDMCIEVGNPNDEDREKLVQHYLGWKISPENTKNTKNTKNTEKMKNMISEIAKQFRGCSPVQIKTVLNETKILYYDCEQKLRLEESVKAWFAHREVRSDFKPEKGIKALTLPDGVRVLVAEETSNQNAKVLNETLFLMDFQEVLARRMIGERSGLKKSAERFSLEQNDNGLSATAIHEVGHALVSVLHGSKIEKITILGRGEVLGYVSPDVTAKLITKQDYLKRLDICFGGRAAEEIIYGPEQISSGASQDIQTASRLARYMIMQLGMNEKVGPVALETASGKYLDGGNIKLCTDSTMTMAEDEVRKLLKERYSATLEMLRGHGELLKELAAYVYEKEEVAGEDFVKRFEEKRKS